MSDNHNTPARYANLRNGDLVRKRDPLGAIIIVGLSMAFVLFAAFQLFAHTVDEVRAMPRHVEGF